MSITQEGDRSSVHKHGAHAETETAVFRSFSGFLSEANIDHIDLLKLNIEGGEYELLEHILASNLQGRVTDIQVQFHELGPDSLERMRAIQLHLAKTHELTYQYEFVWENWRLKREL